MPKDKLRASKATRRQISYIIQLVEANYKVLNETSKRSVIRAAWAQITTLLNDLENGTNNKSIAQWQRYWSDLRLRTSRKINLLLQNIRNEDEESVDHLNARDIAVARICGWKLPQVQRQGTLVANIKKKPTTSAAVSKVKPKPVPQDPLSESAQSSDNESTHSEIPSALSLTNPTSIISKVYISNDSGAEDDSEYLKEENKEASDEDYDPVKEEDVESLDEDFKNYYSGTPVLERSKTPAERSRKRRQLINEVYPPGSQERKKATIELGGPLNSASCAFLRKSVQLQTAQLKATKRLERSIETLIAEAKEQTEQSKLQTSMLEKFINLIEDSI